MTSFYPSQVCEDTVSKSGYILNFGMSFRDTTQPITPLIPLSFQPGTRWHTFCRYDLAIVDIS
jgi:hypothetical protein